MQQHKQQKKLTFEFPIEEYIYLKMACAKKGVSMKEFVSKAIIRSVEDYEDELDRASIEAAKKDIAENGTISWKQICEEMEWEQ